MPNQREDDLFRESTMTFGQHLEELRKCLFKSVVGLAIGLGIGLLIGDRVVKFIQRPLENALNNYYQEESINRFKDPEKKSPWAPEEVEKFVKTDRLLADEYFADPAQILESLKNVYPETLKDVRLPPKAKQPKPGDIKPTTDDLAKNATSATKTPEGLVPLYLWHYSKDDPRMQSKAMAISEPFTTYVKASLLVGAILSSPWILFQIWQFVAAGLYPHERRYVQRYFPFSVALFLAGAALAFFVVFDPVLKFLLGFNRLQGISPELRIKEWLGFVMLLPVGFGIGFQLPLIMLFMERIGVLTVRSYLSQWRIAILVIFVTAAILTPPDPYSMLLLACPLTFLYFGGILLCKFMPRHASPFEQIGVDKIDN